MAIKLPANIQKKLLKEAKKNNGRISAATYRERTNTEKTQKKAYKYNPDEFHFTFDIAKLEEGKVKFTLIGRHLSTNVATRLHLGKSIKYKKAIKKAAREFILITGKKYLPKKPFLKATLYPIAYNPKSRDDDGNTVTLKIIRDLMTEFNYIIDDSREFVQEKQCKEILTKDYKIEVILVEDN